MYALFVEAQKKTAAEELVAYKISFPIARSSFAFAIW
jgi:hypothetical protein